METVRMEEDPVFRFRDFNWEDKEILTELERRVQEQWDLHAASCVFLVRLVKSHLPTLTKVA